MNIFEFYTTHPDACLKTAAGHFVTITRIIENSPYPLEGYALCSNDFKYTLSWDINGKPINLPTTHGMELVPYVSKVIYEKHKLH